MMIHKVFVFTSLSFIPAVVRLAQTLCKQPQATLRLRLVIFIQSLCSELVVVVQAVVVLLETGLALQISYSS
jgi:hypothetical protein